MATTKSGGATKLGRDSQPKYLGIKLFAGQKTKAGQILVRQRGTKLHPGKNTKRGNDDTLFATSNGVTKYLTKKVRNFTGKLVKRTFVSIETAIAKK